MRRIYIKEEALKLIIENSCLYQHLSDELKNDFEIALEAVKEDAHTFRYFSDKLRNNKMIAFFAIKEDYRNISYLSERLRNDREIALEAVKQNYYYSIKFLCDEYFENSNDYESLLRYFELSDLKLKLQTDLIVKEHVKEKRIKI